MRMRKPPANWLGGFKLKLYGFYKYFVVFSRRFEPPSPLANTPQGVAGLKVQKNKEKTQKTK